MFDAIFQVLDLYFNRPLWWISIAVTHTLKKQLGENLFLFIVRKISAPRQQALLLLGLWLGRNIMAQERCLAHGIQEAERGRWRPQASSPSVFVPSGSLGYGTILSMFTVVFPLRCYPCELVVI